MKLTAEQAREQKLRMADKVISALRICQGLGDYAFSRSLIADALDLGAPEPEGARYEDHETGSSWPSAPAAAPGKAPGRTANFVNAEEMNELVQPIKPERAEGNEKAAPQYVMDVDGHKRREREAMVRFALDGPAAPTEELHAAELKKITIIYLTSDIPLAMLILR